MTEPTKKDGTPSKDSLGKMTADQLVLEEMKTMSRHSGRH
jgi:hypothetical protein